MLKLKTVIVTSLLVLAFSGCNEQKQPSKEKTVWNKQIITQTRGNKEALE